MSDAYTVKCTVCGTALSASDENELADKYVRHMMALHQKMITRNEALKTISEQSAEIGMDIS